MRRTLVLLLLLAVALKGALRLRGVVRRWLADYVAELLSEARPPKRIILLRHAESEANVDPSVWSLKPDNMIELTEQGCRQAKEAGERIKALLAGEPAMAVISPFWRSYMTMRNIHKVFPAVEGQITETNIEPRIREQEFGNTQDPELMRGYRKEQLKVGRFWYRFPNGESGADVYNRVASFWESLKRINRIRKRKVDNVIIVTHGLTMRLLLAAYYAWSPDTFHTVYNPENCEMWVLKLNSHGRYEISSEGSQPRSTRTVDVYFKSGEKQRCTIQNYLALPQPRTCHPEAALRSLGINPDDVERIDWWCGQYRYID
eukprot:Sspe_Gene.88763::Locus_60697_Transcript_1_1_Confidence_1.000_Length_1123::g.88763::m.88763